MGDMSELRGMIVVITVLGVMVVLTGIIFATTPELMLEDYGGRNVTVPEEFESIDLEIYADTWSYTLNGSGASLNAAGLWGYSNNVGGHDLGFYYPEANSTTINYILRIDHWEKWAILKYNPHPLTFESNGISYGTSLEKTEANTIYNQTSGLVFQIFDQHLTLDLYFDFNDTTYSTPEDAHNHYDLHILIGVTWDQINTSMNAWDIIGMILFFQMPNVHPAVNALIAIPIYACVAYLAYILILRTVGAIFGGGA